MNNNNQKAIDAFQSVADKEGAIIIPYYRSYSDKSLASIFIVRSPMGGSGLPLDTTVLIAGVTEAMESLLTVVESIPYDALKANLQ